MYRIHAKDSKDRVDQSCRPLLYRAWNTELVIQGENQVDQNASAMYFAQ